MVVDLPRPGRYQGLHRATLPRLAALAADVEPTPDEPGDGDRPTNPALHQLDLTTLTAVSDALSVVTGEIRLRLAAAHEEEYRRSLPQRALRARVRLAGMLVDARLVGGAAWRWVSASRPRPHAPYVPESAQARVEHVAHTPRTLGQVASARSRFAVDVDGGAGTLDDEADAPVGDVVLSGSIATSGGYEVYRTVREWPEPVLLPQPVVTPGEALLCGEVPVLDVDTAHTGCTGMVERLTDERLADLDAEQGSVAA